MFADICRNASAENRDAARALIALSVLFVVLTAIGYFSTISWVAPIPRDATTLAVGRDFLNFWMYGRAAYLPEPASFYDPAAYNRVLWALLGSDYPGQNWSYPPSVMLPAAPFALLGYMPALLLWTMLGVALFLWVALQHVPDRRLLIALVFSPAAVFCLMSGQSSFITAAMLITIFGCLDRRPVFAGVLIGMLTLKPQVGLLFPVMLIAAGRWRVFIAAAVTALAVAGLTAALFGPQVWIDFVTKGIPIQNQVLADPERVATPFYPTIFMNVRGTGASYAVAMAVQLCFTAFAIGAIAWAFRFRRHADPQLLTALFLACSVCGVPYMLAYDTLALTFATVMLLATDKLDAAGRWRAKLVYWLPLIQIGFGQFYIPGPALIPAIFALYLVMRLKDETGVARAGAPWTGGRAANTLPAA